MSLLQEYRQSLKMVEVEEYLDLFIYRPPAFALVKALYHTDVTPNQLTVVSMILGIIGGVLLGVGTATAVFAAGVLIVLYDILDCSDGQLARLKKNGTRTGRILDGFADYIVNTTIYLGLAVNMFAHQDYPVFWVLLTVAAGFSNTAHAIFVDYYRNRFLDVVLERSDTFEEELESFRVELQEMKRKKGRYFDKLVIRMYLNYSGLQRRLTSGFNGRERGPDIDRRLYYRLNRLPVRFWLFLGPTTQLTFLVICAFFNRLDVYVLGLVIVGNLWAVLMFIVQSRVNRRMRGMTENAA